MALPPSPPLPGQPPRLPALGATLDGKYVLERVLGKGGMACVFEATHIRLRQRVAVKMLLPSVWGMPETMKRFEREARAAVQLRGPNVARTLDVDTSEEGIPYIVMEFLEGHDLAQEMSDRGTLPVEEAVGYVLQACTAMAEAHALGIVHRDLKPSNLFLCPPASGGPGARPVVKVLDFGIVKLDDGMDTTVTRAEVVLGTPAYMAPEQFESARTVDGRADIWSLGVILYELLACELPFAGKNAAAVSHAILREGPLPLAPRRPDAPAGLVEAVHRAMARDPAERFPDVVAFATALVPFGPEPKTWLPPAAPSRPPPRPSRAPREAPPSLDLTRTAARPRVSTMTGVWSVTVLAIVVLLAMWTLKQRRAGTVELAISVGGAPSSAPQPRPDASIQESPSRPGKEGTP